jgi:hypothetical protein
MDRLVEWEIRFKEQEHSLNSAQHTVEQEKQQARKDGQRFQNEQKVRYDEAIEAESKRLAECWEHQIADIRKDANSKLQKANELIQKLEGDVRNLAEERQRIKKPSSYTWNTRNIFRGQLPKIEANNCLDCTVYFVKISLARERQSVILTQEKNLMPTYY